MRVVVLFLSILFSIPSIAYWDCHWPFRTPVTIAATAALPNEYQVPIAIDDNLYPGYNWSNDGRDLRVLDSDDATELDFYLDNWNAANKTATLWVRLPSATSDRSRTIYLYYGNRNASPSAQVPPVFTYPGIRFHTRNTTANPRSYSAAVSRFESATDGRNGYGCKFITNFDGISNANQFPPGGSNFGARSESYFEVQPGESGVWEFRYGSDFGRGGGLFIDSVGLDQRWNTNLWWNNSWSNRDVLQGSINLTVGYHKLEVLGFEDCCDGGITVQFKKPGGSWQTFTTSNIDIRSAACPVETSISFGNHEVCEAELQLIPFGNNLSDSKAPDMWVVNSPRELVLKSRNNGSKATLTNTSLALSVPTNLRLSNYSGNGWNCNGSLGNIDCRYSSVVPANTAFPDLSLHIEARSDSPASGTVTATLTGHQFDSNTTNNNISINREILQLILPSGLTAGCGQNSGLLTGFFDTRSNPDSDGWANSFAEMNTLEQNFATANYLYGYTRLPNVDGSNNPFGNDEGYLTLFDGFIYLQQDGNYRFAVDGDDAVELTLFDHQGTAHRASWYGGHAASNGPSGTILEDGFARGYYRFRFRHQENVGGDVYTAFWQQPAASSYQIIPASQFSNCQGGQSVTLSSSSSVISDPINSNNFKAIPGAVIEYRVVARNNGVISTDLNSTSLQQTIDDGSEFKVGSLTLSDGTGNSASGLDIATANIEYLDGSGAVIIPTGEFDPAVRAFRLSFDGTFRPEFDSLAPEFSYQYQIRLQ